MGEVWVQGGNVAAGYWQQPDSERLFQATVGGEGPFLRTGDLGFFQGRSSLPHRPESKSW